MQEVAADVVQKMEPVEASTQFIEVQFNNLSTLNTPYITLSFQKF